MGKSDVKGKFWIYEKKKDAYSMLQSWTCSGDDVDDYVDEWEPQCQSQCCVAA
jgi:hypothetical protein